MAKKKASDRTVNLFDGKTDEEKANEAERIRQGLDNVEQPKEPTCVSIESNVDRWRASAFQGREFVSEQFGLEEAGENQYRLSSKDNVLYLEKTGNNDRGAYSYAGVFFPEGDVVRIAKVIVDAARDYLKATKGSNGLAGRNKK